jgi:MSHA pilin protein MshC
MIRPARAEREIETDGKARGTVARTLFPFRILAVATRGFTLLELIAVLAIAAILAVSATAYFSKSSFDAAAFADLAKSAVSQAQKVAVAQRQTVFVIVTASTLSVCYDAGCTNPVAAAGGSTGAGGLSAPGKMVYTAPSGITISPASFSFDGLGKPSAAVTINVTGATGFSVAAETGYVF